ncbi:neuroendocrine convertase 2-like [Physella acuta]|uniref:neuroendocrine convertase 2-like n=1 Tax=Physella acuta TaxID=109671 RepID=UPI0027DE7291|nr:neuroendocrine convertase 2-like [Physella acuta]
MLKAPVSYRPVVLLLLTVISLPASPWELPDSSLSPGSRALYLNQFAVQLRTGGHDVALLLASQYGFTLRGELPNTKVFILEHDNVPSRSKRSASSQLQNLRGDTRVKHVQQMIPLSRHKRNVLSRGDEALRDVNSSGQAFNGNKFNFSDPKFKNMWYLVNEGQGGGDIGLDLNVGVVWQNGYTGKGVVVCILDDGIDHTHPDLTNNYDSNASTDLNDLTDSRNDPMPDFSNTQNSHGTRCAGEVAAAANNGVCGVGVAYDARIGGVRVLDGIITDALEAEALSFNKNYIDIYSASWGPSDDGATMEGPRHLVLEALADGVLNGRGGRGSIFVWAAGNGGELADDCGADGYVSRPETLTVGSVDGWGRRPYYMERCAAILAVVPTGGGDYPSQGDSHVKNNIITTDLNGGCNELFQGTSGAAPLAAGCIANILQANPTLTWRDVQHIVVRAARVPSADGNWTINGAGHHVSHSFGFGLMDCGRMVQLAQSWTRVPERRMYNITSTKYHLLPAYGTLSDELVVTTCQPAETCVDTVEHVQVYVRMASRRRGDLEISLTSPTGTRSRLLSPRPNDRYSGQWEFTFMTVHNWDEAPQGRWRLEIREIKHESRPRSELNEGVPLSNLQGWSLILFGTQTNSTSDKTGSATYPTEQDMRKVKDNEFLALKNTHVLEANESSAFYSRGTTTKTLHAAHLKQHIPSGNEKAIKKRKLEPLPAHSFSQSVESRELVEELIRLLEELKN